jgi:hypothetical protein
MAVAQPPRAQPQEAADLDAIARIEREALERSQLMDTAWYLTDVYGPRLTGSPHLRAAADYVIERLNAWGLDSPHLEAWGPFGPGWSNDRFAAIAVSPRAYPLTAYPKAWTPGTSGEVRAEAVIARIEDEADFERYRGRLEGKFVLTAPLATSPPPGPPLVGPRETNRLEFARKRMQFFVDEGVAALLEPSPGDGEQIVVGDGRLTGSFAAGMYPWPEAVAPQVVLSADHYNRIARTLERRVPVVLEMNIVNSYYSADPDSFNVIAEIPGHGNAQEVVMIGAHLDSWHAGTGATDNAAGCAVVLEAMRILKATGLKMRRTVRLALWAGSEQGLQGSRAYVARHFVDPTTSLVRPDHARLSAYFNVDNGTGAIRGLHVQGNEAAAPVFERWMAPFPRAGVTTVSIRSREGSDHVSFDAVGLPGFQFIQDPLDHETRTAHSNLDVYDRLQPADLAQNAVIVASFAYHAANREERIPRKPIPTGKP